MTRIDLRILSLSLLFSGGCFGVAPKGDDSDSGSSSDTSEGDDTADTQLPGAEQEGPLETQNAIGRSGYFYLPEGYDLSPLPILLGFHGTGGQGADMVGAFRELAASERFGIVAPDSRKSPDGQYTWEVGTLPGEITDDLLHAQACLDEVLATTGLSLDTSHLLAAGFSGGASSAPYLATNDPRFTHCAVLHGGVYPGGLGDNVIPCWFSTGDADDVRSVEHMEQQAESMRDAGFPDVDLWVFPGSHAMIPQELDALVAWWLLGVVPS